jgi:hypothetical protein
MINFTKYGWLVGCFCLLAGGLMAQSNAPTGGVAVPGAVIAAAKQTERARMECVENRRLICGRILRVLPEGLVVESGYTNLLRQPLIQSWLVPGTVTASRANNLMESREQDAVCVGLVFLTDLPRKRGTKPHQYDYVIIRGYPTGNYNYHSMGVDGDGGGSGGGETLSRSLE